MIKSTPHYKKNSKLIAHYPSPETQTVVKSAFSTKKKKQKKGMAHPPQAETRTSPSYGWMSRLKIFRALFWWGTGGWGGCSTSSAGMVRALLALLVLKRSTNSFLVWGLLHLERWDGARFTSYVSIRNSFFNRQYTSAYVTVFFPPNQIRCSSAKGVYGLGNFTCFTCTSRLTL